jgi:hypothetical protein
MWGALADERKGLLFTVAAGPHQQSFFLVCESHGTHDHILLSQIGHSPILDPTLFPPGIG